MKRMLLNSTFVVMGFSPNSFADYVDIPSEDLEAYKTATIIAGSQSTLPNCKTQGSLIESSLTAYVRKADSGKLNFDGQQPILIFERSLLEGYAEPRKSTVTIVSSKDYKTIISAKVEELKLSDVNDGDLRDPHITKGYVVISFAECK